MKPKLTVTSLFDYRVIKITLTIPWEFFAEEDSSNRFTSIYEALSSVAFYLCELSCLLKSRFIGSKRASEKVFIDVEDKIDIIIDQSMF